nr:MAG TPA: hypothetical protein [Podoviridae sp. ctY3D12]
MSLAVRNAALVTITLVGSIPRVSTSHCFALSGLIVPSPLTSEYTPAINFFGACVTILFPVLPSIIPQPYPGSNF